MKVKKIAALAIGAAMVGATMGFASAQPTVPNIPKDFFVNADGTPNVKIVVGSQGAALDVSSAADIAVALGSLLYTEGEVKDASVIVKKEITEPVTSVDPTDIPVFFNDRCPWGNKTKSWVFEPDVDYATKVKAWWNGAPIYQNWWAKFPEGEVESMPYLKYPGNMVNYTDSVWDDTKITASEIPFTIHGTSSQVNPLNFVMYDEGYIKLSDSISKNYIDGNSVSFEEGNIIDYNVSIDYIQLIGVDKLGKDPENFKALRIRIPSEGVHVKMDFTLESYYYGDADCFCGATGKNVYYIDDYSQYGDPVKDVLRQGLTTGDVMDLLGQRLMVVAVDTDLKDFGNYKVVFGEYHAPQYIDSGESKTFGDYTIKVVDIDVNSEKALLEVSGPAGSKIVTLYTEAYADEHSGVDDYKVLFDGGIYIKLKNVFIGIGGTTSAEVEVSTNLKGLNVGDEVISGWVAKDIHTVSSGGKKYLSYMEIVNKEKLEGTSFTLFNKFDVQYKAEVDTKECENGDKYAVVRAWIDFDPITKTEPKEQTLEVGDELEGWTVDKIEGTAISPSKVTTPITVLDIEVMEAGLDSVDSNLILIGGPVVNSVTAALADKLGVPSDYDGWKSEYGTGADSGVIKYIAECGDINGYGVVLVAGTDREGTKAAAEALMEYLASL